ncbi:hypothetical protein EV196_103274 [Mariniflexile fucanivorans]|uniref:Uncharacterized protein n=1 Tax=Mariniflexile fucanivorans TaxID=264023 RepID=A0A4R1RKX5_9FLAO|nr:hypothetical protein [Mariniflexile fucanivorans]TCL66855.1 hypothetical protein EV196_103274 [Mariniflexile fucanivorans]
MKIIYSYIFFIINICVFAQSNPVITMVDNYKEWGWDNVYVIKNEFINVAVVPDAAGRVLEFNLGDVKSLWINPKLLGKFFISNDNVKQDEWRNFGGYRLVPIPVDNVAINSNGEKTRRWPPPAIMGDSPYVADISTNAEGYQSINVSSGIQNLPVPVYDYQTKSFSTPQKIEEQLQYKRSLYIEDGKSLVFIKHSLINKGKNAIERGLKITSQHPSRSNPNLEDGENFLAYIPFDENHKLSNGKPFEITATPQSRWNFIDRNRFPIDKNNPSHIEKYYNHGTNWKGEVVPGIYELHYDYNLMGGLRIIAAKPWMCFVDKLNKTAFVKIFEPYDKNLNYEYGVNAEIYNSGLETGYLETEIKTPIYNLMPNNSFEYIEIQGAAKIESTPVLDVNKTGVITKKLNFNNSINEVSGSYGVFIEGKAILHVKNESGEVIQGIDLGKVNPLEAFSFKMNIKIDLSFQTLELYIKDTGNNIYVLDSYNSNKI